MKGERIIIPMTCRDSILADLHKSHEGINQSLSLARTCMYWPGMEADVMDYIKWCITCIDNSKMPVEMLHPHKVPTGPWVKIGIDFFQDDSGNKFLIFADYFSKFLFVHPITLTHHVKMLKYLRDLFSTKGLPAIVITNNGPPFNGEEFKLFTWEFDFTHQMSSPHFHQSNGFIELMVKKVKATYRKTDGSPNAEAWALLQLQDMPLASDLPSPAETLHGWPAQGIVLPCPHRPVNIQWICQWLIQIQNAQKQQFNQAHRAKDEKVLKLREHVWFFLNKQYSMKLKWLTGTVREILEQGHSYIIEGPNGKQYRRNRAHLKLVCHDGSSFQDHSNTKENKLSKSDKVDSFQDPRPKPKKRVTFEDTTLFVPNMEYTLAVEEMSDSTSSTPHPSHQEQHISPHSPSSSPSAQLSPRETLVSPTIEDHTAQRQPAFIRPQDIDTQLTTGLAALVQETSPLTPYKKQISAKTKAREAFSTMCWTDITLKLTHFKTPSVTYMAKCQKIYSFQDPCVLHRNWLLSSPCAANYMANHLIWLLSRPLHWIT